ncbi:crossover junction endodeoxyribonuclease RuvC [Ornithinibacillus halophilus]|uniref:Crossover junction endodeoxyribonuclease RuvC n=1 Tax=Ornithinibacillus halophilus TaxID=930117 RepID=A0A1M5G306_9BACI|nr:crossover junction endodeoxyribonuclease RuvC [Ornithinibacillus halophilus]SHF97822.1 crossover junction endodeoxyribonuclease RuvC [Ornithinibacillus halophilus]
MTHLLSIDQSVTYCGYSIYEINNNNFELIKFGTLKLNTKLDYFERIISLECYLNELIEEYQIENSLIEDIQKHKGTSLITYKKLSSLLFFLQYYFYYQNIDCQIIHVNTWRSAYKKTFGLTQVNKEIVYQHLYKLLDKPTNFDNHMSDSIAMGISYCYKTLNLSNNDFNI